MKFILIQLIKFYINTETFRHQIYASIGLPIHACRHQPTCSQYFLNSLTRYGTIHGIILGTRRIASCHPFTNQSLV